MSHAEEIIRKYAAAQEPIAEFGPWLVADKDATPKEAALAEVWTALEAAPVADDSVVREAKLAALLQLLPDSSAVPGSSVAAGALSGVVRRVLRPVVWAPLAAAAAVALFLVLHRPSGDSSVEFVPKIGPNSEQTLISEAFVPKNAEIPEQIIRSAGDHMMVATPDPTITGLKESATCENAPALHDTTDVVNNSHVLTTTTVETAPEPKAKSEGPDPFLKEIPRRKAGVKLSLFGAGGMMASAKASPVNIIGGVLYYPSVNTQTPIVYPPVVNPPDMGNGPPEEGNSPQEPILYYGDTESQFNRGSYKGELSDETHELPLDFGLMVGYQFAKRVSVESGIVYSYLRSTSQQLHYLGVPVYLKYDIFKGQRYSAYVSAGGTVSRCIAGSRTREHPIQMAASLSTGAEYVFNRGFGIFGEVSMNRYFDDHSSMETYYSLNPYSPSFKIGARLTIAR